MATDIKHVAVPIRKEETPMSGSKTDGPVGIDDASQMLSTDNMGPALESKRMWIVEQFRPTECPKCYHPFRKEGKDYGWMIGRIIEGKKVPHRDRIIACKKCDNYTVQNQTAQWCLGDKSMAEALVATGQWTNLHECSATGNMARDLLSKHTTTMSVHAVSLTAASQ